MPTAHEEAEEYFEKLWQQERLKWLAGEVTPASMQNGVTIPVDFCLTTVARLVEQPHAPIKAVEALIQQLTLPASPNFLYPTDSIHISLLGCTSRYPSKDSFDKARMALVQRVLMECLTNYHAIKMSLKGVGIIGNQVFIQVFPHDRLWAEMRRELEKALLEIGETPLTFPNKAPVHMNILRVTGGGKEELLNLLKVVEQLHAADLGVFNVAVIDFMITDFVLAPANREFIQKITL